MSVADNVPNGQGPALDVRENGIAAHNGSVEHLFIVLAILRAEHRETATQPFQARQLGCGGVFRLFLYVSHFGALSRCQKNNAGKRPQRISDFGAVGGSKRGRALNWRARASNCSATQWRTSQRKRQRGRFLRSGPQTTRPLARTFSTQSPLASLTSSITSSAMQWAWNSRATAYM